MSKQCLPSFNFPFTPSVALQQSICDYGRTGPVVVFKDDDDETIRCLPQKKPFSQNTTVRLHAEKPSLPIKLPNKMCRRFSFGQGRRKSDTLFNYIQRNLNNFSSDHGDILYHSISRLVRSAMGTLPSRVCRRFPDKHLVAELNGLVDRFGDDFKFLSDIPSDTLESLFAESFTEGMTELKGGYYGNCLAHQINHFSGDPKIILANPGGPYMDKFMLSLLEFSSDDMVVKMKQEHEAFSLPGNICQINMVTESWDKPLIAVRGEYTCSLFQYNYSGDCEEQGPAIKFLGNLACKTRPCSVIVNPYISGEVAVVMETGSVHLWHGNSCSLEVAKQCSACTAEEFDCYFCEFGPHPRQIIRGNKTSVEILDLRASLSTGKELMTLPSPHFFKDDQFSAVQRHPENPYHYLLGGNQSLVVMDERFQQNPVLKWCHSLLGPIKYINVVPDALPGTNDVLVVVGEYKNHEVHCYQYCYGEDAPHGVRVAGTMGGLPPHPTLNPWKVSPYSDWPDMVDLPNKSDILPAMNKKLSAPLFGLTCIPFENNLSILQLSKEGDLFYQSFTPTVDKLTEERGEGQVYFYEEMDKDHTGSGGCGKGELVLTKWDKALVQNWLKLIKRDSNEANLSALQETDSCYVDVEVLRSLSNLECDSQCLLCSSGAETTNDKNREFETCFYCGLDRVVSDKLTKVCTENIEPVVLTKSYLGLTYEYKELKVFDEDKEYCDPLGMVLLKNWKSDIQTPINLGGDTEMGDFTTEDTKNEIPVSDKSQSKNDFVSHNVPEVNAQIQGNVSLKITSTPNRENGEGIDEVAETTPQRKPRTQKKQKLSRVAGF